MWHSNFQIKYLYSYLKNSVYFHLCLLLLLFGTASVQANERSEGEFYSSFNDIGTGALVSSTGNGYQAFIRLDTEFKVEVNGLMASTRVTQRFKNPGLNWVEAVYVLPLPDDSVVNEMRLIVDDRVIEGQIKEKEEAKKIYVQAKQQGKRAGLLQQQRPNLFTTKVANIGPGETVEVDVHFLQKLSYDQGVFEIRIPLTLTPRYISGNTKNNNAVISTDDSGSEEHPFKQALSVSTTGWSKPTDQVPDADRITPPQSHYLPADTHYASLNLKVAPGFEVQSFNAPYHSVEVVRLSDEYEISTREAQIPMNKDFVLQWSPVASEKPTAAYFEEVVEGESFGLLMVMPPNNRELSSIPSRELILIIDTSGSMSGNSIEQAKEALNQALSTLRPQDYFNVVAFSSGYRKLFSHSQQSDHNSVAEARRFVSNLVANGGTEMVAPIEFALTSKSVTESEGTTEPLRQIVFITDGSVGNETALFDLIERHIQNSRMFTVGIGSAPNSYFMKKAAQFGRGGYTFIGRQAEVRQKMSALFEKIDKPVFTQIEMKMQEGKAEYFPAVVPDLYLGEPLLITTRFNKKPSKIELTGTFKEEPWLLELNVPQSPQTATGVATLWARDKIEYLQDEGIRLSKPQKYKQDILALGLTHRLVTPYTSFVAVDVTPARPLNELLSKQAVPNRMPAGNTMAAPGIGYPNTALGIEGKYCLAVLFLFIGWFLWLHVGRVKGGGGYVLD